MDRNNVVNNSNIYDLTQLPSTDKMPVLLAAKETGLYSTTDGGITWMYQLDSLGKPPSLLCTTVECSTTYLDDQALFVGVVGGILLSTDGGASWQFSQLPTPPPVIVRILPSPDFDKDGIVLCATSEDGVFRSDNRGTKWNTWNFGLYDMNINDMVLSPNFSEDYHVFIATETGVFMSMNGGISWLDMDFPMDKSPVISLAAIKQEAGKLLLFAGTNSNGLFYTRDTGKKWGQVDDSIISGTVSQLTPSSNPALPDEMYLLQPDCVKVTKDVGSTWTELYKSSKDDGAYTAMALPNSYNPKTPIYISTSKGKLVIIQ